MRLDVFISYAHSEADEKKAQAIADFLKGQGIRCWIDKDGLRLADGYDREIIKSLRQCSAVLWLASNTSVGKDYVRHEISSALALGKPVGPVFLEAIDREKLVPPFDISDMRVHGIQYFKGPVEENLGKLLNDLRPLIQRRKRKRLLTAGAILGVIAIAITSFVKFGPSNDSIYTEPSFSLPASIAALPAGPALQVAYGATPPAPAAPATAPQIAFEILARRKSEQAFHPIEDGAELTSEVDDYLMLARAATPGYLYVFQVDTSGKTEWLFPSNETSRYSSGANPVQPGQTLQIPEVQQKHVLYLDQTTGVEHIYAVFSATPWPALEQQLSAPSAKMPQLESTDQNKLILAMEVDSPNELRLRGVGGIRVNPDLNTADQAALTWSHQGKAYTVPVADRLYQSTESFLVVERWFKHVELRAENPVVQ